MKSGKVQRGEECTGNLPPSQLQWDQRRLVFNQGSATVLIPPDTLTRFAEYRPPFKDPGVAVVSLYSVSTVRAAVPGTRQVDPLEVYNAEEFPDFTTNPVVAPISVAGRGLGLPQFKLRFQMGDTPECIVYVDGNSVLALPCAAVTVDALTTPLLVPATKGEVVQSAGSIVGDLVVEALAAVTVSWGKGSGVAGPQGMATYTQQAILDSTGAAPTPTTFRRPPFAKRLVMVRPNTIAGVVVFGSTQTVPLVAPPGLALDVQQPQDVPAGAQFASFIPTGVPPVGTAVTAIWEIGVS
jgi:hypothetical protein